MSLQDYSITWSDALIGRVETHLRDLHSAIHQYYEKAGYSTSVEERLPAHAQEDENEAGSSAAQPPTATLDVVSPAGSFLARTCVHAVPFANQHAERGVGADLVVTMPVEKCSQVDIEAGRYLECRHAFVEEVESCLNTLIQAATKKLAAKTQRQHEKNPQKQKRPRQGVNGNGEHDDGDEAVDGDDNDDQSREKEHGKKTGQQSKNEAANDDDNESGSDNDDDDDDGRTAANMAAAERLARMTVHRMPIHGCYANAAKDILRVRFRRRSSGDNNDGGFHQCNVYETFYVDLHFRPAQHTGRVTRPTATRKHPYYSYLVLEDYMMPTFLKKIHQMCVEADGLRRALVILKCWAHHVGLMAAASGHQEGLNGFLLACMLLKLQEDGIITNATSEANAVRTVWIRLSHGYFLPAGATKGGGGPVVPAAEERGEVAVLRLSFSTGFNVLFRSSAEFFKNVVQRAAEEALVHPVAAEIFAHTPFQQLQLRYDVALSVRNAFGGGDDTASRLAAARDADTVRKSSVFMSPLVHKVRDTCTAVLKSALTNRASFVSAWPTNSGTIQVIVQLTTEPDGRNHLTRGPAIEDTEAVAAFNEFWGQAKTSTRQFADGAIYQCVLWSFPEVVGSCATSALSASRVVRTVAEYALRRHVSSSVDVSVLLGGLEGFLVERLGAEWRDAAQVMQRSLREASQEIHKAIANLPRTVLPCKITEFCVISASERNTEVFPVRPHLALTHTTDALDSERFAGLSTAATVEPIHCVMAIDDKGKIPDTLEAIGLMKGAICAQLAKYIQQHYQHQGSKKASADGDGAPVIHAFASSQSVDLICRGYLFRVYVAHYREVSLLRALQREAEANLLEQKLFWSTQHAKFVSSIAYGHHSYGTAVRLAKRWMSAMMLYEFIAPEAIELLVANAYLSETGTSTSTSTSGSTSTVMGAPRTAVGGFIRFMQLLASHDWKQALVLPFTDDEKDPATAARKLLRKPAEHQAMFIATPYAPTESPFTFNTPRAMILHRLVQLAKGVLSLLTNHLAPPQLQQPHGPHHHHHHHPAQGYDTGAAATATTTTTTIAAAGWEETAVERAMFTSNPIAFDFSMVFHPQLVLQPDRSITIRRGASSTGDGSGGGADGGADGGHIAAAATTTAAAALAVRGVVTTGKTVVRIRQLDELDMEQSREYIAALVEREPAAHAVRTIRAALRDKGMVFYDALAPEAMYVVGVTTAPLAKKSQAMHDEVLRVSRGALLPAPPSAFTRTLPTSAAPSAASPPSSTSNKRDKHAEDDNTRALMSAAKAQTHSKRGKQQQQQQQQEQQQPRSNSRGARQTTPVESAEGAAGRKKARTEAAAHAPEAHAAESRKKKKTK